ncbi:hypothetical protein Tco_0413804 [Tanacetum coccineum]
MPRPIFQSLALGLPACHSIVKGVRDKLSRSVAQSCAWSSPNTGTRGRFERSEMDTGRRWRSGNIGFLIFLGSKLLEILYSTILDLLLELTFVMSLSFPKLLLLGGVFLTTVVENGFLGGTTIVEVILVKGNLISSIVNIRPIGFDSLALVELVTPVEGNKGVTAINFSLCLLELGYVALTTSNS